MKSRTNYRNMVNSNLQRVNKNQKKDKSYYRQLFLKLLVSIIIVLSIIVFKNINTKPTNEVIRLVGKTVNNDFSLESSKLLSYIYGVDDYYDLSNYSIPVFFNTSKEKDENLEYFPPTTGTIYKYFGEIKKSATNKVFNNGIDILVNDKVVNVIDDGIVLEIASDNKYGQYIKVKHKDLISVYYGVENVYVSKDETVYAGQEIGNLGDIEKKTKKLHFEIWANNKPVDPLNVVTIKNKSDF